MADELVETMSLRGSDKRVLVVASTKGIASYDAEFLVAAETANAPLVTADQKLIERSDGRAVSIGDFAAGK